MMNRLSSVALAASVACAANVADAQSRDDVNFAYGGATTNTVNAIDAFAAGDETGQLTALLQAVRAGGLDLLGLSQQLDFATATINDVDEDNDLFWVYAGTNNFLSADWVTYLLTVAPVLQAGGDPSTVPLPMDPAQGPAELVAAMERLHDELGARRFVVPNLPSIGDLPLYSATGPFGAFGPLQGYLTAVLDGTTQAHNGILEGMLQGFEASHPEANVIRADVYSVMKGHLTSGDYAVTDAGCDPALPIELLVDPTNCAPFLYLDIVHPQSSAWAPVAEQIADQLDGTDTDRIIVLGDSFSEVGVQNDTFLRTVGIPFPPPPFTEGRFTEFENVVQQVEDLVGVETKTTAFRQPFLATETFTDQGALATTGNLYVPKSFPGVGTAAGKKVRVRFTVPRENNPERTRRIKCIYRYDGVGTFDLDNCGCSATGGDLLLNVSSVTVNPHHTVQEGTINWLIAPDPIP